VTVRPAAAYFRIEEILKREQPERKIRRMGLGFYLLIFLAALGLWLFCGRREWAVPSCLVQKINYFREFLKDTETEESIAAFVLQIEANSLIHDELEKEIYMVRKARTDSPGDFPIRVEIHIPGSNQQMEEQTKRRLEKRFSGVTVNFRNETKEKGNAVLCHKQ